MKKILLLSAILAFGIVLGVFIGFRYSPYEFSLLESSAQASILTGELHLLRSGQTDTLIRIKENQLTTDIINSYRFHKEGMPLLFIGKANEYEHSRYLSRVAAYRSEYPMDLSDFGDDEAATYLKELANISNAWLLTNDVPNSHNKSFKADAVPARP
jgi:hypothetical protein